MAKIIAIHSFRGGTGKSNITANVAAILAGEGERVGVVDTDIQSPGIHVLFGLRGNDLAPVLNDYLWGRCSIAETAHQVLEGQVEGKAYLIPSSIKSDEIVQVLRQGYDVRLLTSAFRDLIDALQLDTLLIDTHPGLNEETLFALAISGSLGLVMRPDQQDYEGTGVTVEVARSLDVPQIMMIVNKALPELDPAEIAARVELIEPDLPGLVPFSKKSTMVFTPAPRNVPPGQSSTVCRLQLWSSCSRSFTEALSVFDRKVFLITMPPRPPPSRSWPTAPRARAAPPTFPGSARSSRKRTSRSPTPATSRPRPSCGPNSRPA